MKHVSAGVRTGVVGAWLLAAGAAFAEPEAGRRTWPGVVADPEARTVRIEARTTAVAAREPMEFFLVHERSGHDYEAFAVTAARPSHVHEALTAIGLAPGRHVDPERLRFWPRGERVEIRVEERGDDGDVRQRYRAEDTVLDLQTGRPLRPSGFVFTGSIRLDEDERLEGEGYAADVLEPHAIVTFFNLPATVLDIPRAGTQGDLYDRQVRHPDRTAPEGTPITVVISPAAPPTEAGWWRDLVVAIGADAEGAIRFRAATRDDPPEAIPTPQGFAAWARERAAEGVEVWCTLRFADDLSLASLREAAGILDELVQNHDLRIEPPASGDLYYQAFLPDPRFRDRTRRMAQPWEVVFREDAGEIAVRMTRVERDREASTAEHPVYREVETVDAGAPETLRRTLDAMPGEVPVLLCFAPPEITLATLRAWLGPALPTHPVIFVYLDAP